MFRIRISPEEYKKVKETSKEMGITMSDYIRGLIEGVGVSWRNQKEEIRVSGDNGNISVSKTEDKGSTPLGPAIKSIKDIPINPMYSKSSQLRWSRVNKY